MRPSGAIAHIRTHLSYPEERLEHDLDRKRLSVFEGVGADIPSIITDLSYPRGQEEIRGCGC